MMSNANKGDTGPCGWRSTRAAWHFGHSGAL